MEKNKYIKSIYFKIDTKKTFKKINKDGEVFYNITFDKNKSISLNKEAFDVENKTFRIKLYDKEGNPRLYNYYFFDNENSKLIEGIKAVTIIQWLREDFEETEQPKWDELTEQQRMDILFNENRRTIN